MVPGVVLHAQCQTNSGQHFREPSGYFPKQNSRGEPGTTSELFPDTPPTLLGINVPIGSALSVVPCQ